MDAERFKAASEAAEGWLPAFSWAVSLGSQKPEERGLDLNNLLELLQEDYRKHADALAESFEALAALSDSPVKPFEKLPRYYSSAHEATAEITQDAINSLKLPEVEEEVRMNRWTALQISWDVLSQLGERIRRERAKFLRQAEGEEEWSKEAKSPSVWQKEFGISASTWQRDIRQGKLVVKRITLKRVHVRKDCVEKYPARK